MSYFFPGYPESPLEEEDDDGQAGYGEKYLEPAIFKRDDIRLLGKILSDDKALEQLKITRDLNAAYRASDIVQEAAIESVSSDINTLSQLVIRGEYLPELESALGRLQGIVGRTKATGLVGVEQKSVFHDRVDQHFSHIKVDSYKKLQELELHKLSQN